MWHIFLPPTLLGGISCCFVKGKKNLWFKPNGNFLAELQAHTDVADHQPTNQLENILCVFMLVLV
jgi:hypothetical protein